MTGESDPEFDGMYSPEITSRKRTETFMGLFSTWHVTYVGGALEALKDRISSGGSVFFGSAVGMNDSVESLMLGTAARVGKNNVKV